MLPPAPPSRAVWVVLAGGRRVTLCRRFCALCGGCGGVLGGQSVQYAAGVVGHYSFFKECFELFLGQRYGFGDKAFKKPHAAAQAFRPVLALLRLLLLRFGCLLINSTIVGAVL